MGPVAGDLQTDSGSPFDPLPQIHVYEVPTGDDRCIVGRCMFGPIAVGQTFDRVASEVDGTWVHQVLPKALSVIDIELADGVFVDAIDQVHGARLSFDRQISEEISAGVLLVGDAGPSTAQWRRGPRLWQRDEGTRDPFCDVSDARLADDAGDWEPWLLISDSGLWLGRAGAQWAVGRVDGQVVGAADDPRSLLPLLDIDWAVAQQEVDELEQRAPDLGAVPLAPAIRLALSWRSDHWTAAALRWLRDGFPADEFSDEVDGVTDDKRLSQATRHLARKISRRRG